MKCFPTRDQPEAPTKVSKGFVKPEVQNQSEVNVNIPKVKDAFKRVLLFSCQILLSMLSFQFSFVLLYILIFNLKTKTLNN